jgi:hypothetical protein
MTMPRLSLLALIFCFLCKLGSLAEEPQKWTVAMNMGLHGPVRSQRTTTRKLDADPRTDPKLFIDAPRVWVVFDSAGRIIEEATSVQANGTVISTSHISYDSKPGVETSSNGTDVYRTETQFTAQGASEVKTFRNDDLLLRETRDYDGQGNLVESVGYDPAGDVQSRVIYGHDEKGRTTEWQVWGPGHKFSVHMADRFDEDGDLVQRTYFDESGEVVTAFSLSRGRLTSYWQAADCKCSNDVGVGVDGVTYFYETQRDGSLETTVQNHPHTGSNIELTDTERFSGNDTLVEKLAFSYERDSHGNWTKRVVSAWDPNSGAMIAIQEDVRVLTYY